MGKINNRGVWNVMKKVLQHIILKNIYAGKNINEKDYGITKEELGEFIDKLIIDGYVTGIEVSKGWLNNVSEIVCIKPQLTNSGKEYFNNLKQ